MTLSTRGTSRSSTAGSADFVFDFSKVPGVIPFQPRTSLEDEIQDQPSRVSSEHDMDKQNSQAGCEPQTKSTVPPHLRARAVPLGAQGSPKKVDFPKTTVPLQSTTTGPSTTIPPHLRRKPTPLGVQDTPKEGTSAKGTASSRSVDLTISPQLNASGPSTKIPPHLRPRAVLSGVQDTPKEPNVSKVAAPPQPAPPKSSPQPDAARPSTAVATWPEQVARRTRGPGENDIKVPLNPFGTGGYVHTTVSVNTAGVQFAAWPKPPDRGYDTSQKRAVIFTLVPEDARIGMLTAALKDAGIIESINNFSERGRAVVNFVSAQSAKKVHDNHPNGLEISTPSGKHVVFVDLDPEVVVLASTIRDAIMHQGATRVCRMVGLNMTMLRDAIKELTGARTVSDDPKTLIKHVALHYVHTELRIDNISIKKNELGHNEGQIVFASIREAIPCVMNLKKCVAMEGCNVTYGYDPCEGSSREQALIPGVNAPPKPVGPVFINTPPTNRYSTSGATYAPKTTDRYKGLGSLPKPPLKR